MMHMPKRFTKKTENFTCGNCGTEVVGTGYTNHCPKCLYSQHVDINPGDRLEPCGGLMKPVDVEIEKQKWILVHECAKCQLRRRNILSPDDNMDAVIEVKRIANEKKTHRT